MLNIKNTKGKKTRKINNQNKKQKVPPTRISSHPSVSGSVYISKSQLNLNLIFFFVTGSWAERVLWSTSVSPNGAYTGIYT